MQTSSSANLTWSDSASASEWTATVAIPSSRQAHMIRRAISPRFAIRIFLNTALRSRFAGADAEKNLSIFHGLPVGDHDLLDRAVDVGFVLVHTLHGFYTDDYLSRHISVS